MVQDTELIDGVEMIQITDVDAMDPFLMTVVSSSDLWMFISSTGGLTAGRVDRDQSIFPYETDDRLHTLCGQTGPATVLRVRTDGREVVWEPFAARAGNHRRRLFKSVLGDAIVFEVRHPDLGLLIRQRWAPSDRFGWVRTVSLTHDIDGPGLGIEAVDGLLGVMPWGIGVSLQQQMSNLANAYRRSEIVDPDLGIFTLEARIVDHPEPAEALRATTVWSTGLGHAQIGVDDSAITRARRGLPFQPSSLRTGRRGSYVVGAGLELAPGATHRWHTIADVAQSHSDVERLRALLTSGDDLSGLVDDDIRRSSVALRNIIATADGLQLTASPTMDAHHLANTLFNVMRGGTFLRGYAIDADRFRWFVHDRNRAAANRQREWLNDLPPSIDVRELRRLASVSGDPDLSRLAHEYLPLTFSRRHGDPSRPWNHFNIRVRDDDGEALESYQGNWRDIFQNWEALTSSFPAFLPSIIAKFLNASTADGFNPYRITSEGVDWEVLEPDNPWSGIGYWGDHQIVYLDRLLRSQNAHDPEWLVSSLADATYTFADVPYRLAPHRELVRDPKSTLVYDDDVETEIANRVAVIGADGKLVADLSGAPIHVTLLEKLLIPALTKMSNFVPRGGIWMNTQRPEWNDANNALVGYGLSMVTLAHLRRYMQLLDTTAEDLAGDQRLTEDVATWLATVADVLVAHDHLVGAPDVDDKSRAGMLRELGEAFEQYREQRYAYRPGGEVHCSSETLRRFTGSALRHLDDAIRTARRPDGLYHSYNVIRFSDDGLRAGVDHLQLMLEGQVAAISSGMLTPREVTELVEGMYGSELYRIDIDSFVLYPARPRPSFLDRNHVPSESVAANPLLAALVEAGSHDVIERDVAGRYHFSADFQNVTDLQQQLDCLAETTMGQLVADHRADTVELFEQVFRHHEFTGRSSTMYGYEGIGSVYWHMVAKLLVAIQECILDASPDDSGVVAGLVDLYRRVRGGLGFNKSAAEYGAFPTDPYSHTPAHAGAQQPGMTGQVKEELLTRWAELGLTVSDGSLDFTTTLVDASEFRTLPGVLTTLDVANRPLSVDVEPGAFAFTVCQVPVVVHSSPDGPSIMITDTDGTERRLPGAALGRETSREIFDRAGRIARLDVFLEV